MKPLTALDGINWIKQGFGIFRKRPGQLALLFTTYLMILIGLAFIPIIGSLIQAFMAPLFSMVFMIACAQIEATGQLNHLQLRASFSPPTGKRMSILGGIYLAIAIVMMLTIVFVYAWLGEASFIEIMKGNQQMKPNPQQDVGVLLTMLGFFLVFVPPLWFAAPLIVWQKMPVFKAMFYSFFALFRALPSFILYFLGWLLIGVIVPAILAGLLSAALGKGVAMLLLFLMTIAMTIVLYCSFYPTYLAVFGKPELPLPSEVDFA